ncbi:hypothetical protein CNB04245 [Cryptococcus deneoformans JEC21]|uniref:Uncharacterized protein n=1 Tax=Cryptococcus deneoformans (strain JEC21 / ATCC MYA-565) TaxID=214684 RepID=A0A0S2LI63_CRYD1|nr:hypothetical protein CNB04245 [Cryptococcus neoformans var. neoformans JEC21]ALO60415.1 hypothetical protein CNB04245 [Cryptococcus neoformans var. neoformans JEC21]
MGFFDLFSSSSVVPVNTDIPKPRSDASVNAPPPDQHKTVAQFIQEAPAAKYFFDSRRNEDQADTELCRLTPNGGRSCVKVAMHSAALFKSMQSLGFYCALPAEPTRTHMECNRLPGSSR